MKRIVVNTQLEKVTVVFDDDTSRTFTLAQAKIIRPLLALGTDDTIRRIGTIRKKGDIIT